MKNFLTIILTFLTFSATFAQSEFAEKSVLASGDWHKIKVEKTGVYRLSQQDLKKMGVTAANVRIFGYGGAMLPEDFSRKFYDDLPEIPVWRGENFVLFYAVGAVSWAFDESKKIFTHTQNPYSNHGFYFVTASAGEGKTFANGAEIAQAANFSTEKFTYFWLHERDEENLLDSGREFYGEKFSDSQTRSFSAQIADLQAGSASLRMNVLSNSDSKNGTFTVKSGGNQIGVATVALHSSSNNNKRIATEVTSVINFNTLAANNINFDLTYNGASASNGYLNYLELNALRALKMSSSSLSFRNVEFWNKYSSEVVEIKISSAAESVEIWDVTAQESAFKVPTTRVGNFLILKKFANQMREFVAVDTKGNFPAPEIVGKVKNQNIHGLPDCDYLIIANADFIAQAERLAQAHREVSGLSVNVVSAEEVYNEFSSGTPDATAYRRAMKMFFERKKNDSPQYLLLFGDGHFDNRGLKHFSENTHRLLTYQSAESLYGPQSYTSDDYFGIVKNGSGKTIHGEKIDVGVGRFPVGTKQEAQEIVNKTIAYMRENQKGNWKKKLVFLADDGDERRHMEEADSVAGEFGKNRDFQIKKIYNDAYKQEVTSSGESSPLAKEALMNLVKQGALMFNYTGHGGPQNLSSEGIVKMNDIVQMHNQNCGFWVGATCDFSFWDTGIVSGGEALVKNPNGGAIATLSAARTVYSSQNLMLNVNLARNFYTKINGEHLRLGEIVRRAKNAIGSQVNKMTYTLLGDPALMLHFADELRVEIEAVNGRKISEKLDTLRALLQATFVGKIVDENGVLQENFNGFLHATIFDKQEKMATLANDAGTKPFEYLDYPSTLFSGKTAVENGRFELQFRVPMDIKYNFGKALALFYAADEENDLEASGNSQAFFIGGQSDDYLPENQGPLVNLYLNSPEFKAGDILNEAPLFVANVEDESGINTTGGGIGHDIILRMNGDTKNEIVLNDHYEADFGTYKRGTVSYKLPTLDDGRYSLFFRVWDLQNNSTSVTTYFNVKKGYKPTIFSLLCYPNPATEFVNFVYQHDRPEELLEITAQVFDFAGRLIFSKTKTTLSAGNRTEPITWHLKGGEGNGVSPGVYFVRMLVSSGGEAEILTSKIIVK